MYHRGAFGRLSPSGASGEVGTVMWLTEAKRVADPVRAQTDGVVMPPYAAGASVEGHYACGHGFLWRSPPASFYPPNRCPMCTARQTRRGRAR